MNRPLKLKLSYRRHGMLSMVVLCVFIVILFGVAFFILAKIIGGQGEVRNATDAGILNVAKKAINKISVPIDPQQDIAQAIYPDKQVNLLNYNKLVAQSLLVSLNAQKLGPDSRNNAKLVAKEVKEIGKKLTEKINETNLLEKWFVDLSHNNSTKMWGNGKVNPDFVKPYYMRRKGSTNIVIGDNFPEGAESPPISDRPGAKYLAGYVPLSNGLMGVPVFPDSKPHLVDYKDKIEIDDDSTPPNAFYVQSKALEGHSGTMGGALSAAIVGVVDSQTDFPVSVRGGYIEFVNKEGTKIPSDWKAVSNSDNIFNNELFFPPGVTVMGKVLESNQGSNWSSGGYPGLFSQDEEAIHALYKWGRKAAYCRKVNKPYPPFPANFRYPVYIVFGENQPGVPIAASPSEEQMNAIMEAAGETLGKDLRNCLDDLQHRAGLRRNCRNYLVSMSKTYHPLPKEGGGYGNQSNYSAVDYTKAKLINEFQEGNGISEEKPAIVAVSKETGLGKYPRGPRKPEPAPLTKLPLQREATIRDLINQVGLGKCATTMLIHKLYMRAKEIDPEVKRRYVVELLNTKLPMGKSLYIYSPGPGSSLIISEKKPPGYSGFVPDSDEPAMPCESVYPLDGLTVNTDAYQRSNLHGVGDDLVRRKIFMNQDGKFFGTDKATLKLSSGYGNLLARLEFSNRVEGQAQYWTPN